MQPLKGVKVLDLSRLLPGSFISLMLADYGADVVMVENPSGEPGRLRGPYINNISTRHLLLNRNKKSITLNLRNKKGQELLKRLVKTADVLVENFRPDFMDKNDIGYRSLAEVNPRLIYCSLTGYGHTGVDRNKPGHDINYLSETGVLGLTRIDGDKLNIPGVQVADINGSLNIIIGILLSLIVRNRTNKGQYVEVSMVDSLLTWLPTIIAQGMAGGKLPGPGEFMFAGQLACYNTYKTKDGRHMSIGAVEPKYWAELCKFLGCEEYIELQLDPSQQHTMMSRLENIISSNTMSEWVSKSKGRELCMTPVKTVEEALNDPRIAERKMVFHVEHPEAGDIIQLGYPIGLSDTPAKYRRGAPSLGEHNQEIYSSIGMSAIEIKMLQKDHAI